MKTQPLKQALDKYGFDAAFGGARRDEESSRAKERVFSFRSAGHRWDPRRQRPEMWNLLNGRLGPGETVRVFPLSNWTERDVWRYIAAREARRRAALLRRQPPDHHAQRPAARASTTTACRCCRARCRR